MKEIINIIIYIFNYTVIKYSINKNNVNTQPIESCEILHSFR